MTASDASLVLAAVSTSFAVPRASKARRRGLFFAWCDCMRRRMSSRVRIASVIYRPLVEHHAFPRFIFPLKMTVQSRNSNEQPACKSQEHKAVWSHITVIERVTQKYPDTKC